MIINKLYKNMKKTPIIGIDLGTTYCCASVYFENQIIIIPNELGDRTTPSFVSFFDNNEKLVGTLAKERIIEKQKLIYNSKRFIGRRFKDKEIQEDIKYLQFKIIEDETKEKIKIKIENLDNLEKDQYYPEEISAILLKKIRNDAEFYLEQKYKDLGLIQSEDKIIIKEVVITVPAYFNQRQRKATQQAAEIAGLKVRKIINEPTAASLAYAYSEEDIGENCLIFDFGGGTLDLTLLSYNSKQHICKILCSSGDTHLGGQDIDNKIYDIIKKKYKQQIENFYLNHNNFKDNKGEIRILKACEKAKILLSSQDEALIFIDSFLGEINIEYNLKKNELEEIVKEIFNKKIKECLNNFIKKAKKNKNEIKNIILVGGSTKIPILKDLIKDYFENNPHFLSSIEPNEVVAMGAGIIAGQIYGEEKLKKYKLFDVTSLSLGTNLKDGKMDIIIPKSTRFPISKKKIYYTCCDNQVTISNKVYEGEDEEYKNNYLLGDFYIKNLTERPKGKTSIELEFILTTNLILEVKAKELGRIDNKINEKTDQVKLEEPKGFFNENEIEIMKNFIENVKIYDWQNLYNKNYQKNIVKLKEHFYKEKNNYGIQLKIIECLHEYINDFLKTNKYKNTDYKVYSLYIVYFFSK